MVREDELARDYLASTAEELEEAQFLKSIPWIIDAGRRGLAPLLRGLKFEATRFLELPDQVTFTLITPLWKTPPRLLNELILSVRCQSCPLGVADRVNRALKVLLRPAHRVLREGMVISWRSLQMVGARRGATADVAVPEVAPERRRGRPFLLRRLH